MNINPHRDPNPNTLHITPHNTNKVGFKHTWKKNIYLAYNLLMWKKVKKQQVSALKFKHFKLKFPLADFQDYQITYL